MKPILFRLVASILFIATFVSAHAQYMSDFAWNYSEKDSYGYPVVTICVGESHQLQYTYSSSTLSDPFNYDNWVFYELMGSVYGVVDNPSVFSLSSDGYITGLKVGKAQMKPTGKIHRASGTDRLSIVVVDEFSENEYNNDFSYANMIHDNQSMKFSLSSGSDVDVFKFNTLATPYMYFTIEYLGESGASASANRCLRYEVYDKNASLTGSGTLSFKATGERYAPMYRMVGTGSYGYIRFSFPSEMSNGLIPQGYFKVWATAENPDEKDPEIENASVFRLHFSDGTFVDYPVSDIESMEFVESSAEESNDDHEYVDLGLSVKWATCNVGATLPEEYGDYFAWGETTPKETYNWSTYKWCRGSLDTMTKYCTSSSYGTVDNKTTLEPEDDVAHIIWGGAWRMPTKAEQDELRNNCTWTWTTQNGVKGYTVKGPNGNSIFLPAAGFRSNGSLNYAGSYGDYWSSSLDTSNSSSAYFLVFLSGDCGWLNSNRYYGHSVRPVCQ